MSTLPLTYGFLGNQHDVLLLGFGIGAEAPQPPIITPPTDPGFWDEGLYKRIKPKEIEHKPRVDKAELRAMLEEAFDGPRPAPVREVVAEHKLEKGEPKQAFNVDWDALLADTAACIKALAAHEAKLEDQRHREARAAEVHAMVERLRLQREFEARVARRNKLRRIAAGLLLSDD